MWALRTPHSYLSKRVALSKLRSLTTAPGAPNAAKEPKPAPQAANDAVSAFLKKATKYILGTSTVAAGVFGVSVYYAPDTHDFGKEFDSENYAAFVEAQKRRNQEKAPDSGVSKLYKIYADYASVAKGKVLQIRDKSISQYHVLTWKPPAA